MVEKGKTKNNVEEDGDDDDAKCGQEFICIIIKKQPENTKVRIQEPDNQISLTKLFYDHIIS